MKNVYDLRKEKNLYFILPEKHILYPDIDLREMSIAVIVNLYYVEDMRWYLAQLAPLEELVDIYIVSSNPAVWDRVSGSRMKLIKKQNRGRDISALLVACRDIIFRYGYVCFLHDKKPKSEMPYVRKNTEDWVYSLWHNILGDEDYVRNIVGTFEENPGVGVLAPPEPGGVGCSMWGGDYGRRILK